MARCALRCFASRGHGAVQKLTAVNPWATQWVANINIGWKPVLLFGKVPDRIGDVVSSAVNDNDKRFHDWGQSESGMGRLVTRPGNVNNFNVHALLVAAMTHRVLAACLLNEDAAHGLGGGTEEMSPAREVWIRFAHQPQPGFMDERGGLQRLVGRFIGHFRRRELAQLLIDQRQQSIGGLGIAVLNGLQNAGNVAQSATITRFSKVAPDN